MREIEFRGKTPEGKWMYGWYVEYPLGHWPLTPCIIPNELAIEGEIRHEEILEETLGQYTGHHTLLGTRIYEGDVLEIELDIGADYTLTSRYIVAWSQEDGGWMAYETSEGEKEVALDDQFALEGNVIGNIHDNPDLMEARHD